MYHPFTIDFVIFWESPTEQRSGHILVSGLLVGVGHGDLSELVEAMEGAKVKRSIYAETQREKMEVLAAIKNSEWNLEKNPVNARIREPDVLRHDFASRSVFPSNCFVCLVS